MTPFINQVLQELLTRDISISDYTFVLPSRRAGAYLKQQVAKMSNRALFMPRVMSIEDFAEEVAGLKSADNLTVLFEFYTAYLRCTPKENLENFETFSSWAQTLLHDFNEIDRYLIDYKTFFGYLGNIQEMNHWYLQEERTPLMQNYLSFWNKLPEYYEALKSQLEARGLAYQGMVYRMASEKIEDYLQKNMDRHIFLGFNALNSAEQQIFQKMMAAGKAEVFWDADETFLEDPQHDVSLFLRQYLKKWPVYEEQELQKISSEYKNPRNIDMIGVPRNVGQAKYVGELLSKLSSEELKNTAVVLGDESLLLPVLNSLPPNVQEVNVTMGFALKNAPVAFLFEHLLKMHASRSRTDWYYKDVVSICNHPLIQKITGGFSGKIADQIKVENLIYVPVEALTKDASPKTKMIYELCFGDWKKDPALAVKNLQELIYIFRDHLDRDKDRLTLEFLYQFHMLFNQLGNLLQEYEYVSTLKSLFTIFKDLLSTKNVDFRGKPFSGLQLMGVLESRVLDFENVILTSVNEGVLPSGKSNNSFVPFDLKCAYGLPTYKEKDAVYAYHFYHLLQRAKNVHLLYNTESDGLNAGEKSRFLLQLELEAQEQHVIKSYNVAPQVPAIQKNLRSIKKSPGIMERIKERAAEGFSPSALTSYIRNPLDFYKQQILKIREPEEVEETVAYNTLGTVVHDTLEHFYRQWLGQELKIELLEKAILDTPSEIEKQFKEHYTKAPMSTGKNLLIFEVAKRYVLNFLRSEIKVLKKGNTIRILQVEEKLKRPFLISGLNFPVNLKGTVDRVDEFNGKMRIIDYKTGRVDQNKVEVVDWEEINSDYDRYSKPFQILMYACLLNHVNEIAEPAEAGIISFKNLKAGFLKFSKKDKTGKGAKKDSDITGEVLMDFEEQLKNIILEICNPEIPFEEKEIKSSAW